MEYKNLEKNIMDTIIEQQLKLGYEPETVGLYYPAASLKHSLQCPEVSFEELDSILELFIEMAKPRLGNMTVTRRKGRYCIKVPPEGSTYIHEHMGDASFISKLIEVVGSHHCTMEDILEIFYEFSPDIICEKMENEDFDYMICFVNEEIDAYRYCIKQEGKHMIYHRFTKEDYEELRIK